ncbi:hypothetical protein AVEN_240697-1, partial [Araneus ventricosus]
MNLVMLKYDQMTRMAPELQPPLQTSVPHQREDVWHSNSDLPNASHTYMATLLCSRILNLTTRKSTTYHKEVHNLPQGSPALTTRKSRIYHQVVQNLPPGSPELTTRKSSTYHQEVQNLPPGSPA